MKLTPAIRAALYAETGAYTDRDAYVSDMALSSVWGDAETPRFRRSGWHCSAGSGTARTARFQS